MKIIKVKRINTDLFTDEEIDLIDRIYKNCNNKKLKKARKRLEYFDTTELLEKFTNREKLNKLEVDLLNKVIIIYKTFYSNMDTLIDDIPYDRALNTLKKYCKEPIVENLIVSRRTHEVVHLYPELKGTLDKANVLTDVMCYRDSDRSLESVITNWFNDKDEEFLELVATKKFDGNSGVADIDEKGNLLSMTSRGEDGKGSDLTHLFKKRKFEGDGKRRGVQFEIVMTKDNFKKYCKKTGKEYANLRVAVSSILTSTNGSMYSKYLSLAPIKSSDNLSYKKLNKLYSDDVDNHETVMKSNDLKSILQIAYEVINDISKRRFDLDYAIDGVVFECINKSIVKKYGRKNDINRYMIAFKFPPQVAYPKVTGLKVSIGRTGLATPNLYYTETYFNKNRYDHSSISSAKRVDKLKLRIDDFIKLTYNGDVMPYPDLYECEHNKNNKNEFIMFPKKCKCGTEFTRIGANYYCTNPNCPEKVYDKISFFYTTLGIRDMKDKTVQKLIENNIISGFENCLEPDVATLYNIEGFGEKKISNMMKEIKKAEEKEITEAQLMNALGILGEEFSKRILSVLPLDALFKDNDLLFKTDIFGIGEKTKNKFIKNLLDYKHIIRYMKDKLNIVQCKVSQANTSIVFTGMRPDKDLRDKLEILGFEIKENYNNKVSYVIAKDKNSNSGTIKKAKKNNTPIYELNEFINNVLEGMKSDLI